MIDEGGLRVQLETWIEVVKKDDH